MNVAQELGLNSHLFDDCINSFIFQSSGTCLCYGQILYNKELICKWPLHPGALKPSRPYALVHLHWGWGTEAMPPTLVPGDLRL